jgi:hypothetical protein
LLVQLAAAMGDPHGVLELATLAEGELTDAWTESLVAEIIGATKNPADQADALPAHWSELG